MKRIPLNMATMKAIDAIYATLPKLNCKKLCQDSCGPIPLSTFELQRIKNKLGREIPSIEKLTCPLLSKGGCKVYDIRPLICRLWGIVDNQIMKCPHGCTPERWLTDVETYEIMKQVNTLGDTDGRSIEWLATPSQE